ncbi:MAG: TrkH family potassium uptake protein [Candidatus ainarchaeum sp.]|nr:TrkH family potassium uptake protein [Candidatus ainarchaeum sp.]
MAFREVLHITSQMLRVLSVLLLFPVLVALIYGETYHAWFFAGLAVALFIPSALAYHFLHHERPRLRHALAAIAVTWLFFALIAAIPYLAYGFSPVDSVFEATSGWSGTGLSILNEQDYAPLPKALHFWRCFTQWAGGLGVVVMALLIYERPATAGVMFAAEGRSENFMLNLYSIGRAILAIYLVLSIISTILFMLAGLPLFDAVLNMMSTLSTGGFSPNPVGIGGYGQLALLASIPVMLAGGISFVSYYALISGRVRRFLSNPEIQFLFILLSICIAIIAFDFYMNGPPAYLEGAFYAVSAVTGAGASGPARVLSFPQLTLSILIMLMTFGACYGSTTGALKLWRVILLYKITLREVRRNLLPKGAQLPLKVYNAFISPESALATVSFVFVYFAFLLLGSTAFMVAGFPALSSLFTVSSAQGNVGLAILDVPSLPWTLKLLLAFHMYIGRMEILPFFVLLQGLLKVKRV